jgi:anti-anti-sigma factor
MDSKTGHIASLEMLGPSMVVQLAGDFDLATCGELEQRLDQVVAQAGAGQVSVDFGAVTFLDATVLGVVVRVVTGARRRGVSVVLCNLRPFHRRLFDIAGDSPQLAFGEGACGHAPSEDPIEPVGSGQPR